MIISMKNILIFILPLVAFTFATVAKDNKESSSSKIKTEKVAKISESNNKESKVEYFDALKNSNSGTKNTLGIGENKQGIDSAKTEICSISSDSKGKKSGAGLCGVPSDKSNDKTTNTTNKEPS